MSRSNDTKLSGDPAIAEAKIRMDAARRTERRALERVKRTGNPEHRREYIRLTREADRAEDAYRESTRIRDTGWVAHPTDHGVRYHRERGRHLQLDVEMQVTTWVCSRTVCNVLRRANLNHPDAETAARWIERDSGVPEMALPEVRG